jgi:hypothetical protein
MLKMSRLVPGGTADNVNGGGLDEQRATPVHAKLSDIAVACERATSTVTIVVSTAVITATWRYALNATSHFAIGHRDGGICQGANAAIPS